MGEYALDQIDYIPSQPSDDLTRLIPGGKALNIAVELARRGVRVKALGVVGRDLKGDSVIAALESNGVDTRLIRRGCPPRGMSARC